VLVLLSLSQDHIRSPAADKVQEIVCCINVCMRACVCSCMQYIHVCSYVSCLYIVCEKRWNQISGYRACGHSYQVTYISTPKYIFVVMLIKCCNN